MNVANLQLEGLLMAVAAVNKVLVEKNYLTRDEIDGALQKAKTSLGREGRLYMDMSAANRSAVCFPIRFLQTANLAQFQTVVPSFSAIARTVAQSGMPFSDQH